MKTWIKNVFLVVSFSTSGLLFGQDLALHQKLDRVISPKSGYYIKADAGHTLGTDIKTRIYDIGFGYKWSDTFKTDVNYTLRPSGKYRVEHGPVHSPRAPINNSTLMLNLTYTMDTESGFKPYIGLGLGGFHNSGRNIHYTSGTTNFISHLDKSGFTGSLNLGVEFILNDSWSLDLDYKAIGLGYIKTERYDLTGGYSKVHDLIVAHELMLGLSYNF